MISETMPLNQWPVEKLYQLQAIINKFDQYNTISFASCDEINSCVIRAIKDAEQELSQLPFN